MVNGGEIVVSEVGYTTRDGAYWMFVNIPGHAEQQIGPFKTKDAVQAAIDDFSRLCESSGGITVTGGQAN